MIENAKLTEISHPVVALASAVPSSASPQWVSVKNAKRLTVIILTVNDSTGSTCAITLNQATAEAGTGSKTLAFSSYDKVIDVASGDTFTTATASSNTFNTDGTASKNGIYIIEVDAASLDVANGFDYVQVGVANSAHQTVTALYLLRDVRFAGAAADFPSAIV